MSVKKSELLRECGEIFNQPHIVAWYEKNLTGESQYYTIEILESGVITKELTVKEALAICLIIGVQWFVKFEGVK